MITRANELNTFSKPFFDGKGEVQMRQVLQPEQFCGHGRLFNQVTIQPGCSLGWHTHEGESETYFLLQGKGLYSDNGKEVELEAGDCAYCPSGEGHSIENIGSEPLVFMALIVNA